MAHGRLKKGGVALIGACVLVLAGCGQAPPKPVLSAHSIKPDKPVSIYIPSWQNSFSPVNTWQNVAKSVEEGLEKNGVDQQEISVQEVGLEQEIQDVEKSRKGSIDVVFPAGEPEISRQQFGNLLSPLPSPALSKALSSAKASFVTTLPGLSSSISLPSMYEIGKMEASSLLAKIKNYRLTPITPFPLLILLPSVSSPQSQQDCHELFEGMWSELSSYFEQKLIYDPAWNGQNWQDLMVDVTTKEALQKNLKKVIDQARETENSYLSPLKETISPNLLPNIGAVIACNDFVATQIGGVLKNMGYQGTVADANTSLSQSNQQKVVNKQAPPSPSLSMGPEAQKEVAKALIKERKAQSWPILIGFGALSPALQNVVNAREWSTGLVNRSSLASAIAAACMKEEKDASPSAQSVEAITVDENNFKKVLIETGFVSPTQAGL